MAKRIKIKTQDIAIAGIFLSLILIFVLAPIPSPLGVSMAFIPLIAVILAADVKGFWMGLFIGGSFGVASWINSFLHPTLMAPMFQNPFISILPRAIIPVTAYFAFKGVKVLLRKRSDDASTFAASTVSSITAVCTNTGLVLAMMAAWNFGDTFGSVKINAAFFAGLLGFNFVFEIAICAFVAPIIATGLRIALGMDKKGGNKQKAAPAPASPTAELPKEEPTATELSEGQEEERVTLLEQDAANTEIISQENSATDKSEENSES